MKLSLLIISILVAGVLGYGYYLHRKLQTVMNAESAKVMLEPYVLKPLTVPTRSIDLGFARFELPASVPGEPVQMGDTLFIVLDAGTTPFQHAFGPPVSDADEAIVSLLDSTAALTGEKAGSWFELRKRVLSTRPFTVWSLPFLGKRKAVSDATMIAMKGMLAAGAPVVRILETQDLGFLVTPAKEVTLISVCDKQKKITQEFVFMPDHPEIDQVMAALIASYRFTSEETTEWRELLKATGIRRRPEAASAVTQLDEEEGLAQVADEARQHRAARQLTEK